MGFILDTLEFLAFCFEIFYVMAKLIIDESFERYRNDLERRTQECGHQDRSYDV